MYKSFEKETSELGPTKEELGRALEDVLDGVNLYDLPKSTELSEERAIEIFNILQRYRMSSP